MVAKTIPTSERNASVRPDLRIVYDASAQENLFSASRKDARPRSRESWTLLVASIITILALLFASLKLEQANARRVFRRLDTVPTQTITVNAGDSLWTIASAHPVDGVSTPELVSWLMDENDLASAVLALGQSLTVPETSDLGDA
jgi:predicted nucleic acid-binding protein